MECCRGVRTFEAAREKRLGRRKKQGPKPSE